VVEVGEVWRGAPAGGDVAGVGHAGRPLDDVLHTGAGVALPLRLAPGGIGRIIYYDYTVGISGERLVQAALDRQPEQVVALVRADRDGDQGTGSLRVAHGQASSIVP